MASDTHLARRAARRVRAELHAQRVRLHSIEPVRRTAHRIPDDRVPPPPRAFVHFGDGSWVVPPAEVQHPNRISIGAGVVVMEYSSLRVIEDAGATGAKPLLTLADGVTLARFNTVVCAVGVTIGERVASSDSASIYDTWWPGAPVSDAGRAPAPVVIGRHAYLGCNSTVCPGVTVGEGAFVGEGSVVLDDVPAHSVVYGHPARVVRRYDPTTRTWIGDGAP